MEWIAASTLLLGIIYFAVHYRGFRRGLLYIVCSFAGVVAVGGIVVWYIVSRKDAEYAEQRRIAKSLIKQDEIMFTDAELSLGQTSQLSAVVINNSGYELAQLALKVIVTDCPDLDFELESLVPKRSQGAETKSEVEKKEDKKSDTTSKCSVVGQDIIHIYINVPSGQKRAFETYVNLRNLPKLKEWSWYYTVEEIANH